MTHSVERIAMKRLMIMATCLALLPVFGGCGGRGSQVQPEGPKKSLEEMQKAAAEVREKMKKNAGGGGGGP
jgi:hypothetical protein